MTEDDFWNEVMGDPAFEHSPLRFNCQGDPFEAEELGGGPYRRSVKFYLEESRWVVFSGDRKGEGETLRECFEQLEESWRKEMERRGIPVESGDSA